MSHALNHYKIISAIGKGGMGEVWKARDTRLDRDVAIKTLPEAFARDVDRLARFEREARLLASLNHPNIASIYGLEEAEGNRFLVLELVEGETLAERLSRGIIPLEESLAIAAQIAAALDAAHEKGVVHRDLKPANIKVTPAGKVKVLDFGLAKALAHEEEKADASNSPTLSMAATQHGFIMGTAAYMSPEQARGEQVDKRADIWAYGVVLHEMLTGKRLFEGKTISDTLAAVLMKEPDLSQLPAKTSKLIRACLERDPKRRLRDIGEAWRLLEEGGASAAQVKTRSSSFALVAAALFAALAGLAVWAPWRAEPERPVERLEVDLGSGVELPPYVQGLIISPDGKLLAYENAAGIGIDSSGVFVRGRGNRGRSNALGFPLFVQRLDQIRSKPVELQGADGTNSMAFSPDSQWIAFANPNTKLSKVSVEGGSALQLADVPANFGIAWGDDGTILAGGNTGGNSGLWRIPAKGGNPVMVPLQLSTGTAGYRVHQILPGSKTALLTVYDGSPGQLYRTESGNIETMSLSDGARKVVVRGATSPLYLPSGHLIYMSKATLFAIPFDLEKQETRGNAVQILDDVEFNTFGGTASLSFANNGTFVYRKGSGVGAIAGRRSILEWVDSNGKRSPLISEPRAYVRPRFSPDGSQLALLIEDENRDEWVYDLRRDAPTKVTYGGLSITTPAWLDNSRLIFGSGGGGIYWTRATGGEPQLLLESRGLPFVSSYSPTLNRLAYFGLGPEGMATVAIEETNGQLKLGKPDPFLRTQRSIQGPEFSPDGRWLAYTTSKSGREDVVVRAFPEPASGQGAEWPISTNGGTGARWLRTGRELLYRSGDQIMAVPYTVNGDMFIAGKPNVRVAKLGGTDWDLAPDGRIAVVVPVDIPQTRVPEHTVVFLHNFFDELRRRVH